ncbi:MAG: tetratricopeptide repeat protein [Alphaproteobacteria bacterium]|nr:tetratricopeptide repeat protein [Alphaproteobacteria bacterium]
MENGNLQQESASPPAPDRFVEAIQHHQAGRLSDAERLYRALINESAPGHVAALNNLGLIVTPPEAEALFRLALDLKPDYVEALINLASVLKSQGRDDEAIPYLQQAVHFKPDQPHIHFLLGSIFQNKDKLGDAVSHYEQAIAFKPDYLEAHYNLGLVFGKAGQFGRAALCFQRVLILDPNYEPANRNLMASLENESRLAEARVYRDRVPRPQALTIEAAQEPRRTVLILTGVGPGMIPFDALVPLKSNNRMSWCIDCATNVQEESLPPYDVVFNIIGNAEHMDPSLSRMIRFLGRCQRPVLNPPAKVILTRRDLMPVLLSGIDKVVVPPVMRLRREEMDANLVSRLAAGGVTFPMLVRPISGQEGRRLYLAESPEQLATFTAEPADGFFFIVFHDYRNSDGFFRKYRTIFVDRRPYHYHLAISPRWLVHYFSAEMLAEPWKLEEERRFLEDPNTALGPAAMAAIEAIGQQMDMDYAGIDYTILPDGRVLIFEANATMSVNLPDVTIFPHKQSHVMAIFAAFEAMLEDRVRNAQAKADTGGQ